MTIDKPREQQDNESNLNALIRELMGPPRNYDEGRGLLSEDELVIEYFYGNQPKSQENYKPK